jgi:uncharacterized protein with PIN domain
VPGNLQDSGHLLTGDLVWSQPAPSPRFYADNNVHRLGRGLRTLGYDTELYGQGSDNELRRRCHQQGRILLSRDSDFANELNAFVLETDRWQEQLQLVVRVFRLDSRSYRYSLCLNCNRPVHKAIVQDYASMVPDWVLSDQAPLWRCSRCRRLFWAGSHLDDMNERYDRLLAPARLDELPSPFR